MKVVSTEALTKLIQLVKSAFISVDDTVETSEVELLDIVASKDLSNITQATKSDVTGWGMPSDSYIDKTLTTGTYTAEANGYVQVEVSSSTFVSVTIGNLINASNRSNNGNLTVFVPIQKDKSYTIAATQSSLQKHRFIYAEGEI